jgi:hypothetical protein
VNGIRRLGQRSTRRRRSGPTQSAKIVDEHLKTVDRSNVELVRAGLEGNVGTFGRSINQAIVTKNRSDIGAKLFDYLEQMQRFGVSDLPAAKKQGGDGDRRAGPLAGYNPEQVRSCGRTSSSS